jgi:hypothetical protein
VKKIRYLISALFITGSGLYDLKAQNTLVVKEAGKQTPYALKNIQKLTFIAFGGPDGRSCFVTLLDRKKIETFRNATPGREWQLNQ